MRKAVQYVFRVNHLSEISHLKASCDCSFVVSNWKNVILVVQIEGLVWSWTDSFYFAEMMIGHHVRQWNHQVVKNYVFVCKKTTWIHWNLFSILQNQITICLQYDAWVRHLWCIFDFSEKLFSKTNHLGVPCIRLHRERKDLFLTSKIVATHVFDFALYLFTRCKIITLKLGNSFVE